MSAMPGNLGAAANTSDRGMRNEAANAFGFLLLLTTARRAVSSVKNEVA